MHTLCRACPLLHTLKLYCCTHVTLDDVARAVRELPELRRLDIGEIGGRAYCPSLDELGSVTDLATVLFESCPVITRLAFDRYLVDCYLLDRFGAEVGELDAIEDIDASFDTTASPTVNPRALTLPLFQAACEAVRCGMSALIVPVGDEEVAVAQEKRQEVCVLRGEEAETQRWRARASTRRPVVT